MSRDQRQKNANWKEFERLLGHPVLDYLPGFGTIVEWEYNDEPDPNPEVQHEQTI